MKVALVGFDIEGSSTYEFLKARGDEITVCDQNPDVPVPSGVALQLGPGYLGGLDNFDMIVRTAGLHPNKILAANPGVAGKITTHINLFFENSPTRNIIGVTGTKGKGTTSTLVAKILEAAGKDVRLGGNIGVPPLGFMNELNPDSWVVLELSSFQLIDLQQSPHIATCLMVVPEHLNWHADMREYTTAKQQLFAHQHSDDVAIYFADNDLSRAIADAGEAVHLPYFTPPGAHINDGQLTIKGQTICTTDDLKLLGEFNWQNACAAVTTAWQVTQDVDAIQSVLTSFTGLPHRLEYVATVNGAKYYDDSFGTTPETAIVAMQSFEEPKIVILGGSDKGASFEELAQTVIDSNVRAVVAIGETGPTITALLEEKGYTDIVDGGQTMNSIIETAQNYAKPGDVVLLSTGCASFGLFANYKDRGDQFKRAVQALAEPAR